MNKKKLTLYILIIISLSSLFFFYSFNYLKKEEQRLLNNKYELLTKQIHENINLLIDDKKNATHSFAIASSRLPEIKELLQNNNYSELNFKELSNELKNKTKFKNIWFQIVDKEGNSLYRSWTDKKGDSLLFRFDIKNMLKRQKSQVSISVGRYDMTFKSMIPIFHKNNFLGFFEVITHFNSIAKLLENSGFKVLILADKDYYEKLTFPFSKNFLDKYYVANVNASEKFKNQIKILGIEKILNINSFLIKDGNFYITNTIKNINDKNIGYIILSKNIKDIDISEVLSFKKSFLMYLIITVIVFSFLLTFIFYYFYSNKINIEKKKAQQILNSQKNIIIITDGKNLNNANKQFLVFFNTYSSIEEFKNKHQCICDKFIQINDENYLTDKDYDGNNWAEHILLYPEKSFKCAMKRNNKVEHFSMNVNLSQFKDDEKPYIIVTFTNITLDVQQKQELKKLNNNLESIVTMKTIELKNLNSSLEEKIKIEIEKNKKKDTILFQQNKMASMGEMLNNIAHQWRQPLSAITTSASSLKLKDELKSLEKDDINYYCDHILNSSNYLSQTINDFSNFFKKDEEKINFYINDTLEQNIKLIKEKINSKNIEVKILLKDKIEIFGNKNEFQQALLNIITNSIDALSESSIEEKLIIISYEKYTLSIQDNANGIKENIIQHIFDPYFTTKHKSQGTGIGLYMAQNILENNMNFKLEVENKKFIFNNKNYFGANFTIRLKN